MQELIVKELNIRDVWKYILGDPGSKDSMTNNVYIWKQLANQQYPIFADSVKIDDHLFREKLLDFDHHASKFINKGTTVLILIKKSYY